MAPAVKAKNISKHYKLYNQPAHQVIEALLPFGISMHDQFTALKNINLTIEPGDSIGIIGKNGSGKSTLLQIIAQVMTPDSGKLEINGSIAALLELGAGFNPNFTGRENVFLYGSILGMSKAELEAKYQDILDFAGIGDFINQPVKTYSSGMYVRLCFSVAISRDPDILIVDEALAVGDEAFQRKCYKTIRSIIDRGKTLIFVSHSAQTILELCNKAILLDHGEIISRGAPKTVVDNYQQLAFAPKDKYQAIRADIVVGKNANRKNSVGIVSHPKDKDGYFDPSIDLGTQVVYESQGACIKNVHIATVLGNKVNCLMPGVQYSLKYEVEFTSSAELVRFGSMFKSEDGVEICGIRSHSDGSGLATVSAGQTARISIPFKCTLAPGTYFVNAGVSSIKDNKLVFLHRIVDAIHIKVEGEPDGGLLSLQPVVSP